jgi:hypothetical protein
MNLVPFPPGSRSLARVLALLFSLMSLGRVHAQPTIVSTVPPTGATGVSLSAAVIFTFSEVMSNTTTAYLFDSTTIEQLPTSPSWSAGNTVLTCTPTALLPAGRKILWYVDGKNPAGDPLAGYIGGTFTTVSGSQLMLTNAIWSGGAFGFDVTSQAGQTFTVEYSSTMRTNEWQALLTTNSPAGLVHIVDPQSSTNRYLFYRARSGS